MTSVISNIVGELESGGGTTSANVYGQLPAFQQQYGVGAAGVDNYAAQVLQADPNATLGDFYSGYNLNTGNPANTPGVTALVNQNPAAFTNLVNNAGYDINTPLSSLVGDSSVPGITVTSPDLGQGTYGTDNGTVTLGGQTYEPFTIPGTDNTISAAGYGDTNALDNGTTNIWGGTTNGIPTGEPGVSGMLPSTSGSSSGDASTFWATLEADFVNYLTRGGLIMVGLIALAVGGYAVVKGEGVGDLTKRVTRSVLP